MDDIYEEIIDHLLKDSDLDLDNVNWLYDTCIDLAGQVSRLEKELRIANEKLEKVTKRKVVRKSNSSKRFKKID